jgi:hypothetical protein
MKLTVVNIGLEKFDAIVGWGDGIGHDWISRNLALTECADVFVIAGDHCEVATKTGSAVSTGKKDQAGDWLKADKTLGRGGH